MSAQRHARAALWLVASAVALMLATAGTASAGRPETFTDVSTFSDSFSGPFEDFGSCTSNIYDFAVTGHTVVHWTYFADTGAFHFHFSDHGKAVITPVDGIGPSYTGIFDDFDLVSVRAVRQGDLLAEGDTDLFRTMAHGSDGSRLFLYFHAHFNVNANGETTVDLEMDRLVCR
jgi:hypothetical protein